MIKFKLENILPGLRLKNSDMKKYLFASLLYFISLHLQAQVMKNNNQFIGFGKFILGKPTAAFGDNITYSTKYTKDNHEFKLYNYLIIPGEPVEILNILFNSTILTFDDKNKLVAFSFIKFYKKKDSWKFEKDARTDAEKLNDYLAGELNDKGENKMYDKTSKITEKGQEWNGSNGLLKVRQQHLSNHSVVEISFAANQ